eukprot:2159548-Rhodomonas_salina.1
MCIRDRYQRACSKLGSKIGSKPGREIGARYRGSQLGREVSKLGTKLGSRIGREVETHSKLGLGRYRGSHFSAGHEADDVEEEGRGGGEERPVGDGD